MNFRTLFGRVHPGQGNQPWREATWLVLDLETTGLDLRRDDIVSVGAVAIKDGAVDPSLNFYSLVRPTRPSTTAAMCVHGLLARDLFDAPSPREVAHRLSSACRGTIVVAHGAWIEEAMLRLLSRQTHVRLPRPTVDTAALARAAQLPQIPGRELSLEGLARSLDLPAFSPHHALGDALTTAVVFLALATRLDRKVSGKPLMAADLIRITLSHPPPTARW